MPGAISNIQTTEGEDYMVKKNLTRRVLSVGLFYFLTAAATTWAADITDALGLGSKLDDIVNIFKSKLIRVILIVAVGGCAIGLIVNKDNETMKKRFLIIGVAAIILLGVQGLVDFIWTPKG
jgi:hypothetical protein